MASPYLIYSDLVALAAIGGYQNTAALSNLSAVFLLSSCVYLREKWLWQNPIDPIDISTYQDIVEMIEQAEYEIMSNIMIGTIVPAVYDISNPDWILLDGTNVLQSDFPELAAIVPSAWLVGSDIVLPDMTQAGLFGENVPANIGSIVGENSHVLTVSEMPSHNHTQNPHQHSEIIPSVIPTAAGLEPALASLVTPTPSLTGLATATNNPAGGDGSHNNIQQSLTVNWYIVGR